MKRKMKTRWRQAVQRRLTLTAGYAAALGCKGWRYNSLELTTERTVQTQRTTKKS
jgi:hypothetical protein